MNWRAIVLVVAFAGHIDAADAAVIGTVTSGEDLSENRITRLPEGQAAAWRAYLDRSAALMQADKAALAAERLSANPPPAGPPAGNTGSMPLDRPPAWYGGPEAAKIVANILSFQTPAGGWGKNQDRAGPPRLPGQSHVPIEKLPAYAEGDIQARDSGWRYVGTLDNGATISELRFLARAQTQAPGPAGDAMRAAFLRGIDYLLEAQFPNGGWPQVYPLQGGYHDAITFNDGAVPLAATLLLDVGGAGGDFAFVPASLAARARAAAARATRLMLDTQVVVDGRRTIWGQQHDALTLAPIAARNFEPAALSTDESVDILLYLRRQPERSAEINGAIRAGTDWLRAHALREVEWTRRTDTPEGRRLLAKPGSGPLWARFYDLKTFRPIFGDRDRSIHGDVNEVSIERRNGYSWFNTAPLKLLAD